MDNGKGKKDVRRIKLYGNVQGIGFRPYVAALAKKYAVHGYVKNIGSTVELGVEGSFGQVAAFLAEVQKPQLPFAVVEEVETLNPEPMQKQKYSSFEIVESSGEELGRGIFIPPDLPLCEQCQEELRTAENKRCDYPFNSCVSCGPRFSIIECLPYDRENTTMAPFAMCPECRKEYTTVGNRRHHAQTIGCNSCGPVLLYCGQSGRKEKQAALEQTIQDLLAGKIAAIKGIGGYHLACLPCNGEAVRALRVLKGREEKPFAVMFLNLEQIQEVCDTSTQEENLLISAARPIVLLPKKKDIINKDPINKDPIKKDLKEKDSKREKAFAFEVTEENDSCGCFLPYTAIQVMILQKTGPLVMTSANKSDSPLIKDDDEILTFYGHSREPLFAGVLYHEREILRQLDDSVARVIADNPQLLRRGRGYVPQPIPFGITCEAAVAGMGGDLKSSFCLASGGYAYVSQYIGDLQDYETMLRFENTFEDYRTLLGINPEVIACDSHPLYHSSAFAGKTGLPVLGVQHHHAHIASVMTEHLLMGRVLGVAFDGTGYGTDGSIWGGEFLVCEGASFRRAGHLKCFKQLGGDSSATDARKMASCLLYSEDLEKYIEEGTDKPLLLAALSHNVNTVQSSSMGRLFDAASSLLGICHYNSYEGKCAVLLEQAAIRAADKRKEPLSMAFIPQWEDDVLCFSAKEILCALLKAKDSEAAASGFHKAVAEMVVQGCITIANRENIRQVALSGGVFQNRILLEQTVQALRKQGFKVFWNQVVPPNDGGIALGQIYIALQQKRR